jgi:hypothetical protein
MSASRSIWRNLTSCGCRSWGDPLIPSIPTHEQLERTDWSSRDGGRARAELLHTFGYDIAHVLLGTAIGGVVGAVVHRRP